MAISAATPSASPSLTTAAFVLTQDMAGKPLARFTARKVDGALPAHAIIRGNDGGGPCPVNADTRTAFNADPESKSGRNPMRRALNTLCVVVCLALAVALVGCTSTATRESTGEYVDDSAITAKVKADLAADALVSLFQISVETYKGIVQLSGFVDTREHAEHAAAIAQKVKGVREVKNSLIVKPR
jgi:hypothetical protein